MLGPSERAMAATGDDDAVSLPPSVDEGTEKENDFPEDDRDK